MNIKVRFLCILAFACTSTAMAQAEIKTGYYIDLENTRHEGQFSSFELESLNDSNAAVDFRPASGEELEKIPAASILEIGIANDVKLKRMAVGLDDADYMVVNTSNKYADLKPVTVFLNVLVEGAATLMVYESRFGDKFFLQKDGAPQQLIYKKFRPKQVAAIQENVEFRQQLRENLSCPDDPFSKFASLEYKAAKLIEIVREFNSCSGGENVSFENVNRSKSELIFSAYGGIYALKARAKGDKSESDIEINYSVGADVEVLSPSRKWGFFGKLEAERVSFKATKITSFSFSDVRQKDAYTYEALAFNIMAGARYHFNRSAKNHLFVDLSAGLNVPTGDVESEQSFITNQEGPVVGTGAMQPVANVFGNVGIGYSFNRKFNVSVRAETPKIILLDREINLSYLRVGVNVGYILL